MDPNLFCYSLKPAPKTFKLHESGIDIDMIGAKLFQSGGVMELKTMGYMDSTIRKFGFWTSDKWKHLYPQPNFKTIAGRSIKDEHPSPLSKYHFR